ncbi:MAG TPA: response regulator transcription factor [Verrucomicrobiae bacterium]|nr:response regulator transcription factor [Verrucomicrobiae bacterium]
MNENKIRIALVEDEAMVSGMLKAWISKYRDLELVGCAADGEAGWELCQSTEPDLAIVDIKLPKLDGLTLIQRLMARYPDMRFLTMSGLMDAYTIWRVIQGGVHGYFCKTHPPQLLVDAVRTVARGFTFYGPVVAQVKKEWLSQPESFQKILSEREQDILRGVATGWEDNQIGAALGISTATVETHRKRIRQKLGVHNDRGLLAYARRWGLDAQVVGAC